MTTKGIADVVFCIDASGSMTDCFDAVRDHIGSFVAGLESGFQAKWDLRLDFLAHSADDDGTFWLYSTYLDDVIETIYNPSGQAGRLFTTRIDDFRKGLSRIHTLDNEAPLIALDCCLDFPWRDASSCHRVVIMLTDEPFETGVLLDLQRSKLQELIDKVMRLRVMLSFVGPESDLFNELATIDRSEFQTVDSTGDGLASVDFPKVLEYIGKSVSKHPPGQQVEEARRGLYNQPKWRKLGGGKWSCR